METVPAGQPAGYPIRVVSRLTGIPVDTLRAWERRYSAVEPSRDERGRVYGDADLARLKLLRRLVERGHPIGRIANLGEPELARLAEAGLDPRDRGRRADAIDLDALLEAVDRYDLAALDRGMGRLAAVLSARELALEVVLPFMRLTGQAWQERRFTVAQEHIVSATLRSLLGALLRAQAPRDGRSGIVFATPPGERHDLGITAAATLAAAGGLGVVFLGGDLPTGDIVEAVRRTGARAVVMSVTLLDGAVQAIASVGEVVAGVPAGVPVLLGGAGAESRPEDVQRVGAVLVRSFESLERTFATIAGRP